MRLSLAAASLVGALLFLWPFLGFGQAGDAPALTVALATAVGLAGIELGTRRLDARGFALLVALSALAAGLRLVLVTGIGGFSPFFFLILCAGYALGPSFGFLTGAVALVVSAIATGGVGPWLPYQLFAAGWVGLGAGLVGRRRTGFPSRRDIAALAAYGVVAGFAFGLVMDLWDWSFFRGAPDLGWQPGLTPSETVGRFISFYLVTSLAYDAFRAVGNAAMVVALGAPMLGALARLRSRWQLEIVPASAEPVPAGSAPPSGAPPSPAAAH
jgi:energy-coupling factor transport system substrate-specific component